MWRFCHRCKDTGFGETYIQADVLFLYLNDHDAFKKVLPSKLFKYSAMGKPVWAGAAGEFERSAVMNAVVFNPCDAERGARSFADLVVQEFLGLNFLVNMREET